LELGKWHTCHKIIFGNWHFPTSQDYFQPSFHPGLLGETSQLLSRKKGQRLKKPGKQAALKVA